MNERIISSVMSRHWSYKMHDCSLAVAKLFSLENYVIMDTTAQLMITESLFSNGVLGL